MTPLTERKHQLSTNQAVTASHQHAQTSIHWRDVVRSGSIASLLSTLAVSFCSRSRVGSAAAGTNAASQWVWYPRARFARAPSWRHTGVGYVIHHVSSLLWASGYEATRPIHASTGGRAVRAAGIAALAYVVDYHLVPRRLSPGFEHKVGSAGMVAVYGAFAAGLVLSTRLATRPPRHQQFAEQRQQAKHQCRHRHRQPR